MFLGMGNAGPGSATAVVIIAQASIVIAALAMVAGGLACMITLVAGAITVEPTFATAIAITFGICGTNRRDIGRQQCSCAERQGAGKDGYQVFFSCLFASKRRRGGNLSADTT